VRIPAIYNRVSKEEQARDSDALKRMIFHSDRAAEKLGFSAKEVEHFEDRQSGRDDDRPDFERLRRRLESSEFGLLIVYRIDRITRRLVTNAELAELFQKLDVLVFVVVGERTFDLKRRSDWEDFVNQGVRAEGETRELQTRVSLGLEFRAAQGKFLGAIPFGYKRENGILLPNDAPFPESPSGLSYWQTAIRAGEILVSAIALRPAARQVFSELGWKIHPSSLQRWALSPAAQGHSISKYGEFLGTHPAIVSLDQAETISQKDYDRAEVWGPRFKKRFIHLFAGLCWCSNCGARLASKPCTSKGVDYIYYRCSARSENDPNSVCTGMKRPHGQNTISEQDIEIAVRQKIKEHASDVASAGLRASVQPRSIDPQVAKWEKELRSLDRMIGEFGDTDGYLGQRKRSIENLISQQTCRAQSPKIDEAARHELIIFAQDESLLDELTRYGRKAFFKRVVGRVEVDWNRVVSVSLSDRV
jgi:DNA invertase Pin-like site-specific DNA recombinase